MQRGVVHTVVGRLTIVLEWYVIVIVISKLLKRYSKAKRRAPRMQLICALGQLTSLFWVYWSRHGCGEISQNLSLPWPGLV